MGTRIAVVVTRGAQVTGLRRESSSEATKARTASERSTSEMVQFHPLTI